ncbi:hypothetical protein W02_24610 [Nitrospira sp. KM1]|uniref:helix-turn-helix domain-containing protein n=1 Tax=Nitrospira sp. KM1 TaxID=1936990 RepID=UPI0013A7650C|nr:helix-turn-helix domain-containing protein [Nitrospira sp. KM1]BCA55321.1 hypothetical protein W02_24610 [Nitrospira sp. KM1]
MEPPNRFALVDPTVKEAMVMLGMARSVIYRAIQRGQLEQVGPRYRRRVTRESVMRRLAEITIREDAKWRGPRQASFER